MSTEVIISLSAADEPSSRAGMKMQTQSPDVHTERRRGRGTREMRLDINTATCVKQTDSGKPLFSMRSSAPAL